MSEKKNQIRNTKKKGVPGHPRDMQIFGALIDAGVLNIRGLRHAVERP